MSFAKTLKAYYTLTKPGIIRGNLITATAGFFVAAKGGHIDWSLLLAVLTGTALVIAAGCVFNNYMDQGIDKKMDRTKNRALVSGAVSGTSALIYGTVLGLAGFAVLGFFTNAATTLIGFIGIFFYVIVYGYFKRRSPIGTIVGSIPGATPPAAGYVAVTGQFDTGALLLFLLLVFWQMPHFYAIAMYRLKDYKAAGIPVLPAVAGMRTTKMHILAYVLAFVTTACLLTAFGYTGYIFLAVVTAFSLGWFWKGVKGFKASDDVKWGRMMFGFSLLVLMTACIAIGAEMFLH